jgi:hypothetical protein
MSINKLYISSKTYKWSNNQTQLISEKNIDDIIDNVDRIDCHTSIADVHVINIQKVIRAAQEIYLVDIDICTILDDQMYQYGRLFNELYKHNNKVNSLNKLNNINLLNIENINSMQAIRQHESPVLWTVGCSVTYGLGVTDNDRWGKLLSDKLNLPEVRLSWPGSSINWAADQILRADIRDGDVVVWGVTTQGRVDYAKDWKLTSIPGKHYDMIPKDLRYWNLNYSDSSTHTLVCARSMLQVINFCKKIRATLCIANLLDTAWLPIIFKETHNFIDLIDDFTEAGFAKFIDMGDDFIHPGPKQHQHYAEQIFNFIKEKHHGKTI